MAVIIVVFPLKQAGKNKLFIIGILFSKLFNARWVVRKEHCVGNKLGNNKVNVHFSYKILILFGSKLNSDLVLWPFPIQNMTSETSESTFWTFGRTPWTGDQPVAWPLLTHRTTQHRKSQAYIHASSGIRIYDPGVRAVEDRTYLRQRGHLFFHNLQKY
jgi:hypothetical protein